MLGKKNKKSILLVFNSLYYIKNWVWLGLELALPSSVVWYRWANFHRMLELLGGLSHTGTLYL